jgi:hypothetical protein
VIYRSNLTAPDLQPYFEPLICKPRPNTMGHDALSDPDFEPDCQFFTHDEAAILYNVAKEVQGDWIDIGARTGWTTRHILEAGCDVQSVDPSNATVDKFLKNIRKRILFVGTTFQLLGNNGNDDPYSGACIDGNHDSPYPVVDAALCATHGARVIVLHDFWGWPIQEAVTFLKDNGFKAKIYNTPNGVAVCWRGEFTPPEHTPDPSIDWKQVWRSRVSKYVNE